MLGVSAAGPLLSTVDWPDMLPPHRPPLSYRQRFWWPDRVVRSGPAPPPPLAARSNHRCPDLIWFVAFRVGHPAPKPRNLPMPARLDATPDSLEVHPLQLRHHRQRPLVLPAFRGDAFPRSSADPGAAFYHEGLRHHSANPLARSRLHDVRPEPPERRPRLQI